MRSASGESLVPPEKESEEREESVDHQMGGETASGLP